MLEVPDWDLASWSWFGYGHWSLFHQCSRFWLYILIFNVQRSSMSFNSLLGELEDTECSWLGFGILIFIWIWSMIFETPLFKILALYLEIKVKRTSMSFKSWFGTWRTLEVPDWRLAFWYGFGYGHWSLIHPWSEFWLPILILKVQRTSMSF